MEFSSPPLVNINEDVGDVGFKDSLLSVDEVDLREVVWSKTLEWGFKSIRGLLPIQKDALLFFEKGKNVLVRAEDGNGKTCSYLLHILAWWCDYCLCKRFAFAAKGTWFIIITPTDALCKDVHTEMMSLYSSDHMRPRVALLTSETASDKLESYMNHEIVISTPNYVVSGLEKGSIRPLENVTLILDGIDLLISEGYERALKSIIGIPTKVYGCWVFSNNPSFDVKILRNIIRRNPWVLTFQEDKSVKTEIFPCNVEQYYTLCKEQLQKFLHIYHLLNMWRKKKIVIFTNSIDMCEKVKYFIHMVISGPGSAFGDVLVVRNPDGFNIIYVSAYQKLDFKDANIVIYFDMPPTHVEYVQGIHCITMGELYTLVTCEEEEAFYKLKSAVEVELGDSNFFRLDTKWNPNKQPRMTVVEVAKQALNRGGTS